MKQLIAILFIAVFASCHTVKRAAKTFDTHPKEAAEYCAVKFPVKPFTKTTTKYLPGKPVIKPGTVTYVTVDCDSAVKVALKRGTPKTVKVQCPPCDTTYLTDTLYTHDTTVVENTAVSEALHYELSDKATQADKATANAVKWRGRTLWTWGINALILAAIGFSWYQRRKIALIKEAGKYV